MNIVSWNVNGLRAILKKSFEADISSLNPDILCLQEIKASPSQLDNLSFLDPYPFKYYHSATRPGYSGTAIFSKIPLNLIDEPTPDTLLDPQEGRIQAVDCGTFILVNVYTPNSGADLSRLDFRHDSWDPEFCRFIDTLQQMKPVLVCGDFNVAHQEIDLAHPESNHHSAGFTDEERLGFSRYLSHGWIDVFRHFYPQEPDCYTWWSYRMHARERNVGWRIDYFLASETAIPLVDSIQIAVDFLGSDHAPVVLSTHEH